MKNFCKEVRKKILSIASGVSALHVGGGFSCTEILSLLYKRFYNQNNIILSKGHAGIVQYVILNKIGLLSNNDLNNYCTKKGKLGVHPHINNPGITVSTGSLGHGLSIAAGMALNSKKRFFIILSDGEMMEGSNWEAILLISSLKINNICVIVDYNGIQSSTFNKDTHPTLFPLHTKFKSFGWDSEECNGHDIKKLRNRLIKKRKKPFALIAKTIKGYPVSFMMNNPIWHYRSPNQSEMKIALKEIDEK